MQQPTDDQVVGFAETYLKDLLLARGLSLSSKKSTPKLAMQFGTRLTLHQEIGQLYSVKNTVSFVLPMSYAWDVPGMCGDLLGKLQYISNQVGSFSQGEFHQVKTLIHHVNENCFELRFVVLI